MNSSLSYDGLQYPRFRSFTGKLRVTHSQGSYSCSGVEPSEAYQSERKHSFSLESSTLSLKPLLVLACGRITTSALVQVLIGIRLSRFVLADAYIVVSDSIVDLVSWAIVRARRSPL